MSPVGKTFRFGVWMAGLCLLITPRMTAADDSLVQQLRQEIQQLRQRVADLEKQLAEYRKTEAAAKPAPVAAEPAKKEPDAAELAARRIAASAIIHRPDKEGDGRIVETKALSLTNVRGSQRPHTLKFSAHYPKKASEPMVRCVIDAFATGGIYKELKHVVLKCDDTEVKLPVVDYTSELRRLTGRIRKRIDNELVTADVTAASLGLIARASRVQVQLGDVSLQLASGDVLAVVGFVQEVRRSVRERSPADQADGAGEKTPKKSSP